MRTQLRLQKGFTIIELMVVVAVMAILAAVAAPDLSRFIDAQRVRGAADDVVSVVAAARTGAIKLDRPVAVSFNGGADWCVGAKSMAAVTAGNLVTGNATACDCSNVATCVVGDEAVAVESGKHKGVTMGDAPDTINFDSKNGMISGLGTRTVDLTSPEGTYKARIIVQATGHSSMCVPSGPTFGNLKSC